MRRTPVALALLLVLASPLPSQAQWWGPGGGRPCFGFCRPWMGGGGWARPARFGMMGFAPRPRPFWAGPGGFGPAGFGWRQRPIWWRPLWWRREMQWRRFEAWRRWAALGQRRPDAVAAQPVPTHQWAWRRRAATPAVVEARQAPVPVTAVGHPTSQLRPAWRARAVPAKTETTAVAAMPTVALHVAAPARPAIADAQREPARPIPTAVHRVPLFRPAWRARAVPARTEAAMAIMPAAAIHTVTPARPAMASRVLATAAMLRRVSAARPLPAVHATVRPAAPFHRAEDSPSVAATPVRMPIAPHAAVPAARPDVTPITLRADPSPAAPVPAPPATPKAAPAVGDVPVAPLD